MSDTVLFDGDTELDHYQVIDTIYEGRPARVLYSGQRQTAQSGVATDGEPDLLFDYNQRFVELLGTVPAKKLLLIGGGVYILPRALLVAYPDLRIDVIEIDPGLTELAQRYFGLEPSDRLNIIYADGSEYIAQSKERYDVILLDAFSNSTIPEVFQKEAFAKEVFEHLSSDGVFAANIITPYYGANAALIRSQLENYSKYFKYTDVYPASRSLFSLWLPQNLVLVAQKGEQYDIQLRYGKLPPLR